MKVHIVVRNIMAHFFECKACDFVSDNLTDVAQHVVLNQYIYKP
jgi:hypothetical protein